MTDTVDEARDARGWSATVALKVPFHDIDAMGIVWHGHYSKYFEVARCALLERIDYGYVQMRESGYAWPVTELKIRFPRPLTFGQDILVTATIREYEHRLRISYLVADASTRVRVTRGSTTHVAVEIATGKMCYASPVVLLHKLGLTRP